MLKFAVFMKKIIIRKSINTNLLFFHCLKMFVYTKII